MAAGGAAFLLAGLPDFFGGGGLRAGITISFSFLGSHRAVSEPSREVS